MITIHIIASQSFIFKHLSSLEGLLSNFINNNDFNIIYHRSPPAYYEEADFRGKALIKHDIGSVEYESIYRNNFKFLQNEYIDNPYDFKKGHDVFFEIINKYRRHENHINNPIENEHYVFLLTEVRGDARWLSACDENKNCYIHTNDWEYIINQAELNHIDNIFEWCIINSIFQNLFHSLSNITYLNASEVTHVKVNHSCISDFAKNKLDFIQSLRSGRICDKCMKRFLENNNNNVTLLNNLINIFNNISYQFQALPDELIVFNTDQNLIITKNGIEVGTLNNSSTIIKIEQKQAFIIYLFLLKFDTEPFNIKKIKKLNKVAYWNYIYKCYKFCQSLYNKIQGYETDQDVKEIFRKIFYSFEANSNVQVIFDESLDKPKFETGKHKLEEYTHLRSDFTKLGQIRNKIENIINQENPLKNDIIQRAIERRRNIKRGKRANFDIFTPVIKSHAIWKIEFDRDKVKWGNDFKSQSLKSIWDEANININY